MGSTKLTLLHETATSVEGPGHPGGRKGRRLSQNRATEEALSFPLNSSLADPLPPSAVALAQKCELSPYG